MLRLFCLAVCLIVCFLSFEGDAYGKCSSRAGVSRSNERPRLFQGGLFHRVSARRGGGCGD